MMRSFNNSFQLGSSVLSINILCVRILCLTVWIWGGVGILAYICKSHLLCACIRVRYDLRQQGAHQASLF